MTEGVELAAENWDSCPEAYLMVLKSNYSARPKHVGARDYGPSC